MKFVMRKKRALLKSSCYCPLRQVVALESSAIFSVVLAVRPGMVVPSKREILSGCVSCYTFCGLMPALV